MNYVDYVHCLSDTHLTVLQPIELTSLILICDLKFISPAFLISSSTNCSFILRNSIISKDSLSPYLIFHCRYTKFSLFISKLIFHRTFDSLFFIDENGQFLFNSWLSSVILLILAVFLKY